MKLLIRSAIAALALGTLLGSLSAALPASAQYSPYPTYTTWQRDWDDYHYDRQHVMLGVVTDFSPYRLTVRRRNGVDQLVDLRNGTVIYPTGATPTPGERVALVGRYSNGVFVVDRVIIRG
ncbi:MAG TPA: hypothetical protein VFU90_02005 [Candidatus Tumulicola sp.]|nr:hypothetical protein [Candidatus Tumulicola sp.]